MILGLGIDVVELQRISSIWERFGPRFARKILTSDEMENMPASAVPYLAARFAAKEAAAKALGTGFQNGITFHSMAVRNLATGQPQLELYAAAQARAADMGASRWHTSLSHAQTTACAVVIMEG